MTSEQVHAFLDTGARTGKVAWVAADGRPQVTPIWFVRDGDDLVFNTGAETGKGRALARDPRVSVVVDEERAPYAFVKIDGVVELSEPPADELVAWASRIGGRYMGADRADEFGRRNGVPGELVVRVRPTRVIAFTAVAE